MMESHAIPLNQCPFCDYTQKATTCASTPDAKPHPGDLSVCLNCGEITVFSADLTQRLPSPSEYKEAWEMPEITRAVAGIKLRGLLHGTKPKRG
jgi:hypothetical protein